MSVQLSAMGQNAADRPHRVSTETLRTQNVASNPKGVKQAKIKLVVGGALLCVGALFLLVATGSLGSLWGAAPFLLKHLGVQGVEALSGACIGLGVGALGFGLKQYAQASTKRWDNPTFEQYCRTLSAKHSLEEIRGWVAEGQRVVQRIHEGDDGATKDGAVKVEEFRCVGWYMISLAFETGQGFDKGMMKFEDPDWRIHNYFEDVAYTRISTHYSGPREKETSLGVDIDDKMPFAFKHFHFGKLPAQEGRQFSFLKPENAGWHTPFTQYGAKSPQYSEVHRVRHSLKHVANYVATRVIANGPNSKKEGHRPKGFAKLRPVDSNRGLPEPALISGDNELRGEARVGGQLYARSDLVDVFHVPSDHRQKFFTWTPNCVYPVARANFAKGNEAVLLAEDFHRYGGIAAP